MNRGCLNLKWTCVGSFKKISFKICGGFFSKGTLGGALNMSNFMMSMTKGQASKEFACQIQLTWTSYLGEREYVVGCCFSFPPRKNFRVKGFNYGWFTLRRHEKIGIKFLLKPATSSAKLTPMSYSRKTRSWLDNTASLRRTTQSRT